MFALPDAKQKETETRPLSLDRPPRLYTKMRGFWWLWHLFNYYAVFAKDVDF